MQSVNSRLNSATKGTRESESSSVFMQSSGLPQQSTSMSLMADIEDDFSNSQEMISSRVRKNSFQSYFLEHSKYFLELYETLQNFFCNLEHSLLERCFHFFQLLFCIFFNFSIFFETLENTKKSSKCQKMFTIF